MYPNKYILFLQRIDASAKMTTNFRDKTKINKKLYSINKKQKQM